MNNIFLQKLQLENYRNFQSFEIQPNNNPIILIGENGTGKTNILEAISFLFPGKGLRSAKLDDICRAGHDYWFSRALMQSKIGQAEICTNFKMNSSRRSIEFNGSKIPNNELSKLSNIIWLTPQMDGIFLEGARIRLKFFDRIVYNFIVPHASIVSKYEYYIHERSKILEQDFIDLSWLKIIEEKISEISVEVAHNRLKTLKQIQRAIDNLDSDFPKAILSINGAVEEIILAGKDEVTHLIQAKLKEERAHDKASGRTNFGVHRSDFVITSREKNKLARFCSTGEQKAMLISIMLAHINSIIKEEGISPILLLDEVFAHLDNRRKQYLIDFFISSRIQFWISSTDLNGIEKLTDNAQLVQLGN